MQILRIDIIMCTFLYIRRYWRSSNALNTSDSNSSLQLMSVYTPIGTYIHIMCIFKGKCVTYMRIFENIHTRQMF